MRGDTINEAAMWDILRKYSRRFRKEQGTIMIRGERMNVTEYMRKKYAECPDKDNIFCVGISDAEFRDLIIDYLLPEDWYVPAPVDREKVNEAAMWDILRKYSRRFRKEKIRGVIL